MNDRELSGAEAIVERHMRNASPAEKAEAVARVENLAHILAIIAIETLEAELQAHESQDSPA
jgi:hypothetical protein